MRAKNRYGDMLERIYRQWYIRWAPRLEERHDEIALNRAESELIEAFDDAAQDALLAAFLLGALLPSAAEITDEMQAAIDAMVDQNRDYLVTSLAPDIEEKLQATDWTERSIRVTLAGLHQRVRLYTQAYWTTIWQGLQMANPHERVGWRLHPLAEHCPTCPDYHGDYDSWDAMLAVTGGLPGYANTECGPGCMCEVIIL